MAPARGRDDDDAAEEDAAASAPLLGVYGSQELLSPPEVAASHFNSESGDESSAHKRLLKGFCAYSVAGEVRRPPLHNCSIILLICPHRLPSAELWVSRSRSLRSSPLRSSSPSSSKRTLARTEYWRPTTGPRRVPRLEPEPEPEGLVRRRTRWTVCGVWSGSAEPGLTRASRVETKRLLPPLTFPRCCCDDEDDEGADLFRHAAPASFSLMVYSASVAVQALTVISMGGIADDSKSNPSFALLRPTQIFALFQLLLDLTQTNVELSCSTGRPRPTSLACQFRHHRLDPLHALPRALVPITLVANLELARPLRQCHIWSLKRLPQRLLYVAFQSVTRGGAAARERPDLFVTPLSL